MAFKGLFIGIDRYASPGINWLSCARSDATALHALFKDNLGGDAKLLVDEDASTTNIRAQLEELGRTTEDDFVVIAFSGHGTETHELAVYDTDTYDLPATTISLEMLGVSCSKIPARKLLVILDCCFSGGMGAKALEVDLAGRDLESADSKLSQMSGEGRVIITASGSTQKAWESHKVKHGLLTFHLLSALQGPDEIRTGDRIPVLALLNHVVGRVADAAAQIKRDQHPAVRGTFDGAFSWPVFKPGSTYLQAFPERGHPSAEEDIKSLEAFGFPEEILKAWAGESIHKLNKLQLDAINEFGVLNGEHLVASAPTSSGKTMLGELASIKGVLSRQRTLFLMPLKALVSDKRRYFQRVYGSFGIRTIEATGETDDISPLLKGRYDIALLTYEKFAAIVLTCPYILGQVSTVVVDEVQMIADQNRGANLEFILTLLRMWRREGIEPQVIALSAVIGETNGLERWLGARLLRRNERPVPLDEGLLCYDGRFRFLDGDEATEKSSARYITPLYGDGKHRDWVIPLVQRLISEGKQVIVFRETTGETRHGAKYLAEALRLPSASEALADLPAGDPSQASVDLRAVLAMGVAFHNSHLDREERRIIEEHFRKSPAQLRVIVATTTLAMGVNTPASAVVIVGLEHPGPTPYSVAEYKNLVGRAGRLGFAERGASYLIATDAREEHNYWRQYVTASPEDLASRFLGADLRTLIIRVLVAARGMAGTGMKREEVIEFLESSFGAHQQRQSRGDGWKWSEGGIGQAFDELVEYGLVERESNGYYHLTPLGTLGGESAVEVESLVRAIDCIRSVQPEELTDPALIAIAQTSAELGDVYFPMNKRSTQKEPQHWTRELQAQGVSYIILQRFRRNISEEYESTLRAKKAVACLFYVSGMPMGDIERAVSQFGGSFDGAAGPIRSVTARTIDVLPMVARAAELIHPNLQFAKRLARLLIRLDLGVQGAAVELARYAGRDLERGDYLALCHAGMAECERLETATDADLARALNGSVTKVQLLRVALGKWQAARKGRPSSAPTLPRYES